MITARQMARAAGLSPCQEQLLGEVLLGKGPKKICAIHMRTPASGLARLTQRTIVKLDILRKTTLSWTRSLRELNRQFEKIAQEGKEAKK